MSEEGTPREENFLASEYYFYLFPENSTQAHNVMSLQFTFHFPPEPHTCPLPNSMPSFLSPLIYTCTGVGPSTGAWLVNRPGTTLLKETDLPALRSHQLSLSLSAEGEGLCPLL